MIKASGYRNQTDKEPAATGHAYEVKDEGYVQRTSYIEVCETSAVGRMLQNMGFDAKRHPEAPKSEAETGQKKGQNRTRTPISDAGGIGMKKTVIGRWWRALEKAGHFKSDSDFASDLLTHTGKDSRADLSEAETSEYLLHLEILGKEKGVTLG